MKLSAEQIQSVAQGAVYVSRQDGAVQLHRFTPEQEALYQRTNQSFYIKALSTAGVKLVFETDSPSLYLRANTTPSTTRMYFSFDVFVNGRMIGAMDNFSGVELPERYPLVPLTCGRVEKTFALGEGIKQVCVYFPWSVICDMEEISLADGAFLRPVKAAKKLLAFGDSITHGYDALRPSNRYISRLAEALGAEEVNKAIGAEIFFPPLAQTKEDFVPDWITVAYGANDWMNTLEPDFVQRCGAFFAALRANYPGVPIFALAPIWRKESAQPTAFGEFEQVAADMRAVLAGMEGVTLLDGIDFVPHEEQYFADGRLHPNDAGFDRYFESLYAQLKPLV